MFQSLIARTKQTDQNRSNGNKNKHVLWKTVLYPTVKVKNMRQHLQIHKTTKNIQKLSKNKIQGVIGIECKLF